MFWHLFDKKAWFAPKRFGIGAGWPIAWQGWALIASYLLALGGIGLLSEQSNAGAKASAFALFMILTGLFALIVWRRTEGGWHWRWGKQ